MYSLGFASGWEVQYFGIFFCTDLPLLVYLLYTVGLLAVSLFLLIYCSVYLSKKKNDTSIILNSF